MLSSQSQATNDCSTPEKLIRLFRLGSFPSMSRNGEPFKGKTLQSCHGKPGRSEGRDTCRSYRTNSRALTRWSKEIRIANNPCLCMVVCAWLCVQSTLDLCKRNVHAMSATPNRLTGDVPCQLPRLQLWVLLCRLLCISCFFGKKCCSSKASFHRYITTNITH